MTEPLYPLTLKQNIAIERVVRDARWLEGPNPELPSGVADPLLARLMTVGSAFPKYRSTQTRNAAIFELAQSLPTITVRFIGENLWGDVVLTFGDRSFQIDCRADTETLRQRLNVNLADCRVTSFPGMWEFAFNPSLAELPAITCQPYVTSTSIRFLGGCIVTREGWRSRSKNGLNYDTVRVIDSIPFAEGEVKLGAIALCHRIGVDLYLSGEWSCPAFTFRSL